MDTLKLIRNSETKNPCSESVSYKWHERFRNGRKSTENDLSDGRSALRCENYHQGQIEGYVIDTDLKNVN